jgi:hypothetical protein
MRLPNPMDMMNRAAAISDTPDLRVGSLMTGVRSSMSWGMLGRVENAYATPTSIRPKMTGMMLSDIPKKGADIIFPVKQIKSETDMRNVLRHLF